VRHLRATVAAWLQLPEKETRLVFAGKELKDNQLLRATGMQTECTVYAIHAVRKQKLP